MSYTDTAVSQGNNPDMLIKAVLGGKEVEVVVVPVSVKTLTMRA